MSTEARLAAAVLATVAASAPAQRQFDELNERFPLRNDPTMAVAIGDVDGDGDLDLVFGNFDAQNRLYLNNGAGLYTDATAESMPGARDDTRALALGDVDGDGDLDLVLANPIQNRLYLNNGTGRFTDVTTARMPALLSYSKAVVFGDVDGDGDLDLVLGNYGYPRNGQNRLYLNDGAGNFYDATATRMPAGYDDTEAVALGDVDGDGDLDLVVGNMPTTTYGGRTKLYSNDGTGTFVDVTESHMPFDADFTRALALGDVDGDGDLDIAVANLHTYNSAGQNRLYLNNGAGTFTDATAARMPADLDYTESVALGDVDGDGDLDLVLGNYDTYTIKGQNRLYLNDGTGTFTDATAAGMPTARDLTRGLAMGDVDRDGDLDLVLGNQYQQSLLYRNSGTGTFTDPTAARLPVAHDATGAVALGDVDGDGDDDLVFGSWRNSAYPYGQTRLHLNDGAGTFTDVTAARMPVGVGSTEAVTLADVDADGDPDLVIGNWGQDELYLNDGRGNFTDVTATRMPLGGAETNAVAVGDVDGDGDLDMVVGNGNGPRQSWLYLNDGTGTFTDATAGRMPSRITRTGDVALADVDGDGDLDLVLANGYFYYFNFPSLLYLNDGTGTFTDVTATHLPRDSDDSNAVVLGDVDGDGDLDMVLGNGSYSSQNRLYLNDGTGKFTDATAARMPRVLDDTHAVALADVDGDGDLDLVVGNWGRNRLYTNDGTGRFTDATAVRMPADNERSHAVGLADVDGDGDLDMVFGNGGWYSSIGEQNRLYLNLLRQLDAPYPAQLGTHYLFAAYARHGRATNGDLTYILLAPATANIPLPPLGTLFLDPSTMVPLSPLAIPQPAGMSFLAFVVPNVSGLVGASIYAQALFVQHPLAYLSNLTTSVISK